MKKKISFPWFQSFILFVVVFGLVFTHYFLWVQVVDPLPERDGVYQYYEPIMEYLNVAKSIGNKAFFFRNQLFPLCYSYGILLIPSLVVFTGFTDLFFSYPCLFNIVCILPFVFTAYFFKGNLRMRLIVGLLFCFFPFSQICIKQFSTAGVTVAYSLLAILFFRTWLVYRKNSFLIGFGFCFWIAIIFKHLGFLYLFYFVFTYLLWAFLNRDFCWKVMVISLLVVLCTINFYGGYVGIFNYILSSLQHNAEMVKFEENAVWIFILLSLAGVILPYLFLFFSKNHLCVTKKSLIFPKFFRYGSALLALSCFFSQLILDRQFSAFSIAVYGYLILIFLIKNYRFHGARGFIYLYIGMLSIPVLMIFCADVGSLSYLIFLPILLMLVQTISENYSFLFRLCLLFVFLLFSNFFPDYGVCERFFGEGTGDKIYINMFRNISHNPLGWSRYGFGALKREYIAEISKYYFAEKPLFLVDNLDGFIRSHHLQMKKTQFLYPVPHLSFLEFSGNDQQVLKLFQEQGEDFFDVLFEEKKIPVLMEAYVSDSGSKTLDNLVSLNDSIYISFNRLLFDNFRKSGRLANDYKSVLLPKERPMVRLYLDKRLKLIAPEQKLDYGSAKNISDLISTLK